MMPRVTANPERTSARRESPDPRARTSLPPAAVLVAALLIGLLALQAQAVRAEMRGKRPPGQADNVTRLEQRLAPLKEALPPRGTVGWLTDATDPDARILGFVATGYVLTPTVVADSTNYDLVVGVFERPDHAAAAGARAGLTVQQDYGNGVILFRRRTP